MKILVACGPAIADVVFATPILRALKVQLDDVELHVLASESAAFTLNENPYIDRVHISNASLWDSYRNLRTEKYSYLVNLSMEWKVRSLAFLLNVRTDSLKSLKWKQWLRVNFKIDQLANRHIVTRMFEDIKHVAVKPDELGLDYFIPETDTVLKAWLPEAFRSEYVAFCIHAPYNTRKLTVDRMIELCDKINKPIILLGGKEDVQTGEKISEFFQAEQSSEYEEGLRELNKRTRIYNACGKFNFNQRASVVKQARVVFTFDNEFIAVASAFRKEIFGLWGNTILMFGRYPYRTKFTVLENNKISCRPCSSKGFDKCPKGHFACMNQIVFDFYLP